MYEDEPDDEYESRVLDESLAQTFELLLANGDQQAAALVRDVDSVRIESRGWVDSPDAAWGGHTIWAAVFEVEPYLLGRFTDEVQERIFAKLGYVLGRRLTNHQPEVLRVEETLLEVGPDWRDRADKALTAERPTNSARRERTSPQYPIHEGLTFGSAEEIAVYKVLREIQAGTAEDKAIAVLPLPSVQLQKMGLRTPDLVVVGNGRAVVIEVDGPHHRDRGRYADDHSRDLHWQRCGVHTVRFVVEEVSDAKALKQRLREELRRNLWPSSR